LPPMVRSKTTLSSRPPRRLTTLLIARAERDGLSEVM
jgi:hypothetical protein